MMPDLITLAILALGVLAVVAISVGILHAGPKSGDTIQPENSTAPMPTISNAAAGNLERKLTPYERTSPGPIQRPPEFLHNLMLIEQHIEPIWRHVGAHPIRSPGWHRSGVDTFTPTAIADLIQAATLTPYEHIGDYMSRFYFFPERYDKRIRVHHIGRSDSAEALHDHPWQFVSIILRGRYIEHTPSGAAEFRAGDCLWRPIDTRHRIELFPGEDVWSLVITGPREQDWQFYPHAQAPRRDPAERTE